MKNNNVMSTMLDQMFKNAAESQEDELDFFIDLMEAGITLEDIKEFLMPIFDEDDFEVETLFATDGCTDNWEIFKLYCEEIGVSEDDGDAYNEAQEKFFNDDTLYTEYMKKYIKMYY